jgi:hypothetical protein
VSIPPRWVCMVELGPANVGHRPERLTGSGHGRVVMDATRETLSVMLESKKVAPAPR